MELNSGVRGLLKLAGAFGAAVAVALTLQACAVQEADATPAVNTNYVVDVVDVVVVEGVELRCVRAHMDGSAPWCIPLAELKRNGG